MMAISSTLRSIRTIFQMAVESPTSITARNLADIDLICSVLHDVCNSLTEVVEQIKYVERFQSSTSNIWKEHNLYLHNKHGMDSKMLVELCRDFVIVLGDVLEKYVHFCLPQNVTHLHYMITDCTIGGSRPSTSSTTFLIK